MSKMTKYFTKMSGYMVNIRKYMTDLSESFDRKMKEIRGMMSLIINSKPVATCRSPKCKKGKSNGADN
jgi:hypothetical protein